MLVSAILNGVEGDTVRTLKLERFEFYEAAKVKQVFVLVLIEWKDNENNRIVPKKGRMND